MAKNNSELKSIQKKLMAAIAMVLVASVMVVSSSYAWFTLSTAPEVTGIQTSVGSNGNLEMALIETDLESITTSTGASFPEANNFWGNLVDLDYEEEYHLGEISLAPARLYTVTGTATPYGVSDTSYLMTPSYGTDGRVQEITGNTYVGVYDEEETEFTENDKFGVRGVGTTSGLSAAEIALRDARAEVSATKYAVRKAAISSLEMDAISLADIMINNMLSGATTVGSEDFGEVEAAVENLRDIVDDLKATMDLTVITVGVAQGINITADDITYGADSITAGSVDFSELGDLVDALCEAYVAYTTMDGLVSSAEADLSTAESNSSGGVYQYTDVEAVLGSILSRGDMTIDGTSLEGTSKDGLIDVVIAAYTGNSGTLPIEIVDGIYYDIGSFIGTYSATAGMSVNLEGTAYEGVIGSLTEVPVDLNMTVNSAAPVDETDYYLDYFYSSLTTLEVEGEASENTIISDLYGYAIDLAFRTNAANSNLMLQTDATSRVGEDSTDAVQGSGSYMEFTLGDGDGYTVEQMRQLMSAIRVVLMNWDTLDIYAIAALDMGTAQVEDSTITADLYLYEYTVDTNNVLTLGDKKEADANGATAITALTQNEAIGITALVYLDGDQVDNGDVAINGSSMTGTLNLQFSSSATLVPMDYTFAETEGNDEETALDAPVLTLSGNVLSWENVTNATSYTVAYSNADQSVKGTLTATGNSIDLQTALDDAGVDAGTYTIAVAATADGYTAGTATKSYTYTPTT